MLISAMVLLGSVSAARPATAADGPDARLHDPPVFRCIFEDRARMVMINPAPDVWVAFNPATCGVHKVWRGGMKFRGKVWDFSQDNCAVAEGAEVLAEAEGTLAAMGDAGAMGEGWTGEGVSALAGGWRFERAGAAVVSPVIDSAAWHRVVIVFDETVRSEPFRVEVSDDGGATWGAQAFDSTTHGYTDTDWQFNFKLVESPSARLRIRVGQRGDAHKQLRRLRIIGERSAWCTVEGTLDHEVESPVWPVWRGYERRTDPAGPARAACVLRYDLPIGGKLVGVRDTIATERLEEQLEVTDLPTGVRLRFRSPPVRNNLMEFTLPEESMNAILGWNSAATVLPRLDLSPPAFDVQVGGAGTVWFRVALGAGRAEGSR